MRLKHSSMTTSSSLPKISDILPAIHLGTATRQRMGAGRAQRAMHSVQQFDGHSLLHDLQVNLLHVNLLAELRRELGALQELGIHSCRHARQRSGGWRAEKWCCCRYGGCYD